MYCSSAFSWLFEMETEMNQMFEQMAEATPEEMERLLEETGTYPGIAGSA